MSRVTRIAALATAAGIVSLIGYQSTAAARGDADVRQVFSQALPHMNGNQLRTIGVEVSYAPGALSAPHSHPCAVIAYVLEGSIRTQVRGEAEAVYHKGQTFYEAPNGVHQVSANASKTEPARLLALFTCDHEGPLTVPVTDSAKAR